MKNPSYNSTIPPKQDTHPTAYQKILRGTPEDYEDIVMPWNKIYLNYMLNVQDLEYHDQIQEINRAIQFMQNETLLAVLNCHITNTKDTTNFLKDIQYQPGNIYQNPPHFLIEKTNRTPAPLPLHEIDPQIVSDEIQLSDLHNQANKTFDGCGQPDAINMIKIIKTLNTLQKGEKLLIIDSNPLAEMGHYHLSKNKKYIFHAIVQRKGKFYSLIEKNKA